MSIRSHTAAVAGASPQIEVRNAAGLVSVTAVEGAADIQVEVEALRRDDLERETSLQCDVGARAKLERRLLLNAP